MMGDLKKAIEKGRLIWQSKNGRCSMCSVGDKPFGGLHRGGYLCGNAASCQACHGCLPPGEICQCCYRLNLEDFVS
jgi:hypothetical protein